MCYYLTIMWAVVEISKKQYLVKEGDSLEVERLKQKEGEITFENVLLLASDDKVSIGTPYVTGAKVIAEIKGEKKGEKIISYKYRRRKKSRWKKGHRQIYTCLLINKIIPA
ncbi:MAG: 50S ribosomal protein L21 [Candidatus Omnitrophica bacterium]|nr:50S ribosomal protein L21 [Candidatus Omnitrophota bacterium]